MHLVFLCSHSVETSALLLVYNLLVSWTACAFYIPFLLLASVSENDTPFLLEEAIVSYNLLL